MNTTSVEQAIVQLFQQQRFYAEVISSMVRCYRNDGAIAAVCIKDRIELHINVKRFEELPVEERVAVLKHECEHILRDHIPRSKEIAPDVYSKDKKSPEDMVIAKMKHQSINIAADLAINDHIPNMPKSAVFSAAFKLPRYETMEWYLVNLKDNEEAKNFMEIEGHELWGESEGDKEILRGKIRKAINDAAGRARAAGSMTSDDELMVSKLNPNTVNWKTLLSRFVARTTQCVLESSKKKRNRRYGIAFPGDIKTERLHLGVAIDTSGSVSDEALQQFMAEINNIAKYADVTVVEADCEIKNTYKYDPRKKYVIKGRGGTAYQPAFDFFNKDKTIDALIYFGDMDNYDHEQLKAPRYSVLWAIVGSSPPPANFGHQIKIVIERE